MTVRSSLCRGRRHGLIGLGAALLASTAIPVAAQTTPAGQPEAAESPARTGASTEQADIVVTSRRRSELLIDVPASVTAFTAANLEALGVQKPGDFLAQVPGVFYRANTTSGTSFINIRGVTQSRNAESPVAVVVDGVFLNNPLSFQNNLVNIEQIEVLKGPQGALYGRNASAGAIIVTTHEPGDVLEGIIKAGYGNHQTYRADASVSGPLIADKLFLGLTGYAQGSDGFLRNAFLSQPGKTVYQDPEKNIGGRVRLIYKPTETFKFDLRLAYSQTDGTFNNDIFNPANIGDNSILQTPYTSNILSFNNRKTYDASLKLDWTFDLGTLTAVSGYNNLKESGGGDALPYTSDATGTQWLINEYETYSQEVRFTSRDDSAFRWSVGAYYQHTDRFFASSTGTDRGAGLIIIDRSGVLSGPDSINPASGGISSTAIKQDAWAVFASAAYDLTSQLELSGALRYDKDKEKATNEGPYNGGFTVNPLLGSVRSISFGKLQPKVTLRYKPESGGNLYLTFAQGFKTGGFNPQGVRASALIGNPNTPIRDEFGPETTTTYEAGYKTDFMDRKVILNLAVYHNGITGANYFDFIPQAANQLNVNLDKVETCGVEADVTARLSSAFTASGSFSWAHSEIKKNSVDPTTVGNPAPAFPSITATASLQWQQPISERWQAFARIDDQYRGRIYWDVGGKVRNQPLNLVDVRAGFIHDEDSPLRIEFYCKNCTNRDYVNETIALSAGISVTFPATRTRQFGVEVSKRF